MSRCGDGRARAAFALRPGSKGSSCVVRPCLRCGQSVRFDGRVVTAHATRPTAILAIAGITQLGGTATATAVPLHGTTTGAP